MTSDKIKPDEKHDPDSSLEKALRIAGKRPALPDSMAKSWESTFEQELQATIAARATRRYRVAGGICASFAVVAIYLSLLSPNLNQSTPLAVVAKSVGLAYVDNSNGKSAATIKQALFDGSVISTAGDSFAAIDYQGASVRINENSNIRLRDSYIELLSGQLYIDTGDEIANDSRKAIVVQTPLASFYDIGTQFTVSYQAGFAASSVREGSIVVTVNNAAYTARAKPGEAQHIDVADDGRISQRPVESSGEAWRWTTRLAPSFATHDSTVYEFLQWAARETGLQLEFSSPGVKTSAMATTLHGNISIHEAGNDIDHYIELVLSTTRLSAQQTASGYLQVTDAAGV